MDARIAKLSFVALALIAGCGGAPSTGTRAPHTGGGVTAPESFPTAAAIAALPPPGPVQVDTGVVVGHWEIDGASIRPAPSAIEPFYAELAAQRPTAQRSVGMECVARESARFVAALHGLPGDSVRRFLAGRCGAGAISVAMGVLPITLSGSGDEAAAIAQLHEAVLSHVVEATDPAANRVGLALYREGSALYLGVASALAELDLTPAVPVASGGHLRFHARIARAPSELVVMATSGDRAVVECAITGIQPELDVDCRFAEGDARAYVEILGRDGDAVLCMPLALSIGIASEGAGLVYDLRVPSAAIPLSAAELGSSILALLNGERTQLGVPALSLSVEQSAANATVVPYAFSTDRHAMEQALLYAMAGWEVGAGAQLREGRTIQVDAGSRTDAGQWLFQALETPLERWVLLDPEARVIALGATTTNGGTVGLASTYRYFEGDAESDRAAAEAALDQARLAAGRQPASFVHLDPLETAAVEIAEQGADPGSALDRAGHRIVQSYASARSFGYVASVLAHTPWAADLFDAPHVGLAVRHMQPAGSPWGVYIVVAVALP